MKILTNFMKTFKENIRDWKILILVVVFAPAFVYMMHMYFNGSGTSSYNVALLNLDGKGVYSSELINELQNVKIDDIKGALNIFTVDDSDKAKKMIRDKNADIFITIPEDFSVSLQKYIDSGEGMVSPIVSYGEQTNVRYTMASSLVDYTAYSYISYRAGIDSPMNMKYESPGSQKRVSDFDLYVPALFVLSIIMILFTAGASIIREVEKETITRLSLSKLSSGEFMTALSMNQIIIGIVSLLLTLLAAFSTGYRSDGSIPLFLLIGAITCFSVIGISIITSCFVKNMFGLLTIGCFPFFIMMFFSDCVIPLPKINLFTLLGNQVYLNDILPTATATRALNKVLVYNSGFFDILFELGWMVVISFMYFGIGVLLFKRKYKY